MHVKPRTILVTKAVSEAVVQQAAQQGFTVEAIPFIETKALNSSGLEDVVREKAQLSCMIVFTSGTAVRALRGMLGSDVVRWEVFCLAGATREQVVETFPGIVIRAVAKNATALADEIIAAGVGRVIFFCGKQRRPELPVKLAEHGVVVEEVVLYETVATPKKVQPAYDGIVFYSPSAVDSYFSLNGVTDGVALFAIGETTAAAIKQYGDWPVITGDFPGTQQLLEKIKWHFNSIQRQ